MIRPLRQYHRRTIIALAILLPVAFVAGVAARKPVPVTGELPAALLAAPEKFAAIVWQQNGLFTNTPVQVRLSREQKNAGRFAIELSAPKDFIKPDLLVYCAAENEKIADGLPADAVLLGAFGTAALPLPEAAMGSGRVVILFSLADNEIVDVSRPISFNETIPNSNNR